MTPDRPEGFVAIETGEALVWARPEARDWVEEALRNQGSLYEAAARSGGEAGVPGGGEAGSIASGAPGRSGAEPPTLQGRAPIRLVRGVAHRDPSGGGPPTWAVRHYRRGGWMAPLLGDRYLPFGVPRPFGEAIASEHLGARRIPTPRVVAAAVYGRGLAYRADLVTELVPGAVDLGHFLFGVAAVRGGGASAAAGGAIPGSADPELRRTVLEGAGRLVRAIAEAGARHRDLNVKNLLVAGRATTPPAPGTGGGASSPVLCVVDLDRCQVGRRTADGDAASMGRRLLGSLEKWGARTGRPLGAGEREALLRGMRSQLPAG